MLLRDQGSLTGSRTALNAGQTIFEALGDVLWTARVLASKAALAEMRGADPAPLIGQARAMCRERGITSEEKITSVLRE